MCYYLSSVSRVERVFEEVYEAVKSDGFQHLQIMAADVFKREMKQKRVN